MQAGELTLNQLIEKVAASKTMTPTEIQLTVNTLYALIAAAEALLQEEQQSKSQEQSQS